MRILLDKQPYKSKPINDIPKISSRISDCIIDEDAAYIAELIGNCGHTWCPAIFNGSRKKDNLKEIQLTALDFDGGISFEEVFEISEKYMIPILFAYETFGSIDKNKFRVVFQFEKPITDIKEFDIIIDMIMTIFKGCDTACKDASRMFFGGKGLFYFNDNKPYINIKNLIMNFHKYLKDRYGNTHYKSYIRKFISKHSLNANKKAVFHIGRTSPKAYTHINTNGEKLRNHKAYRSDTLDKLKSTCRLFSEFTEDSEWLYYNQLFGIALNLIHVENGKKLFLDTVNASQYESYKKDWKFYLSYFKDSDYLPMNCDSFCPYKDCCPHGSNMLCSAKIKRKEIIRTEKPIYSSVEAAYADTENKFNNAMKAQDERIHVIKAQTAIGKTHMYLNYLQAANIPCIIAVPTNILKNEVYQKCIDMGIYAMKTPSIEEIKEELPENVYNTIQHLYGIGQHNKVNKYISDILKQQDIPVLKSFIKEKKALKDFTGHIITTHHRLLYSSREWLCKYQIIIDEDILKTMVGNQGTVLISDIEELLEQKGIPKAVKKKLQKIILRSEEKKYFKVQKAKATLNISTSFDVYSLMKAKRFYSDGESVMFYKTPKLKKCKYIILSATANQMIYESYFGKENVRFYTGKQAKYTGALKQYYKYSYSRNYINKNTDAYTDIQKITGDIPTITFKKFSNDTIHFGNSEGCNFMSGQDIAVVGTPHMAECIYKLMAYRMKGNVTDSLHYREVEYNGFKFWFHTYGDELLRQIQFWLIEGELEQSVGRARLLRNDCTVYLFSDFPLGQSEFVE